MTPAHDELPRYARTGYLFAGCRPGELPWAVRRLVLARDDFSCVCCNRCVLGQPYRIHMRKPGSPEADASPENLITVLAECGERMLSAGDPADEARGYIVRPWDDPARVPVAYATPAGQARAWLLSDGRRSPEPPLSAEVQLPRQAGEREAVDPVAEAALSRLECRAPAVHRGLARRTDGAPTPR